MCILIASTLHPDYSLILLSNRDEYLKRPTSRARFWDPPNDNILGPFDLARPEHGTWIGISKQGRLAVLLNFHEPASQNHKGIISRGLFPREFLESDLDPEEWIKTQQTKYGEALENTGGFTMFCGVLRRKFDDHHKETGIQPFHLLSNRGGDAGIRLFSEQPKPLNGHAADVAPSPLPQSATEETLINKCGAEKNSQDPTEVDDDEAICGKTIGISNSQVTQPWPKVKLGVSSLEKLIKEASEAKLPEDELVSRLTYLINTDTYPRENTAKDENSDRTAIGSITSYKGSSSHQIVDLDKIFYNLRYSVFVPTINLKTVDDGTQKEPSTQSTTAAGAMDDDGVHYGTRTNTIILVSHNGHVKYIERTLHSEDTLIERDGVQESVFEFDIEGF